MKKTIYILGNPSVSEDNVPLKIMPGLTRKFPEINFKHFDPTEGAIADKAILVDVVHGIKKVQKFNDLNYFIKSPRNSVHDYDLPLFLGLMLKLKKIRTFTIFGVPADYKQKQAFNELSEMIKRI